LDHLRLYDRVSITLDTFPYNGTTTTCESTWMSVPVITLAGQTHVSRVGLSLLTNMGMPEFIAHTPEQYVQFAVALARDPAALAQTKSSLRPRLLASSLADAPAFARHLDAAYRDMWKRWCERAS
jgi:predicted O-linked N-acetylglucosamine transferase (SPINDLY family)